MKKISLIPFVLYFMSGFLHAETPALTDPALTDPAWTQGVLDNGIRYYIRPNAKPENRLELRLVVDAGSILEADDQQGLAHFLEHAAFNGTTHFAKNDMVKFLESLGVGFGPDLNAYTSFDETVYKLRLPTEADEVVENGYLILADWAANITASDEALEAERGVIIEEWRGRRGAKSRIRDQQFPVMFKGSRYAERLPIGTLEVLQNFEFERLREFYRDWYRPELMSVVAVGDLDVDEAKARIEKYFSGITGPENPKKREQFVHPSHDETVVGTFSDPELTASEVMMMWKMPPQKILTQTDYEAAVKEGLVTSMLNSRMAELTQKADAPYLSGGAYRGGYTRGGDVYILYGAVKNQQGAHVRAALALLEESERARRFGFTEAELERAKARQLSQVEKAFAEKDSTDSDAHAAEGVQIALSGEWTPGIAKELEIHRELLPTVTVQEMQQMLDSWITDTNRVIMAEGPSKDGETYLPTDEELLAVFETVSEKELAPYSEGNVDQPLVDTEPEPGTVVERVTREDVGVQYWTLSNGAKVILKPTDFKQDEILFSAWSPGGINRYGEEVFPHARLAEGLVSAMGTGSFSAVDLQKKLSGKLVGLSPYLSGDQEGFGGGTTPKDLETLLKLVYLRFQDPRKDEEAFAAMQNRIKEATRNRLSDPKTIFRDMVSATLSTYHPRLLPLTLEDVEAVQLEEAMDVYADRFRNANDFTFMFTGDFTPEEIEPLVCKWLGGLASTDETEERTFLNVQTPKFRIEREMTAGVEPVCEVHMVWFSENFTYDYAHRHQIQSMVAAMRIRLREVLREEMGGTYHTSIWPVMSKYPEPRLQLRILFGCDPDRAEDLIQGVYKVIEEVQTTSLADSYIQTVRETQLRGREVDMKQNSFWNSVLKYYTLNDEDPAILLEFEDYVNKIDTEYIQSAAKTYFSTPDQAVFILKPEVKEAVAESQEAQNPQN